MSGRVRAITVQLSHPADDGDLEGALRAEGLTPLRVNAAFVAATTEEHLQQALDLAQEGGAKTQPAQRQPLRRTIFDALATAIDAGAEADFSNFSDDAVLLLAEGLVQFGHVSADAVPFCAVGFNRDDLDNPGLAIRPT